MTSLWGPLAERYEIERPRRLLIALWDGQAGDGPGGTKDMFERAKAPGARTLRLPAEELAKGSH